MKLKHLLQTANAIAAAYPDALECEAVVPLVNPSIGGSAFSRIESIAVGFDWEAGRVNFSAGDALLQTQPIKPGQYFEDAQVVDVQPAPDGGVLVHLKHAGPYHGARLRFPLKAGARIRLLPLPPRAPRKEPQSSAPPVGVESSG